MGMVLITETGTFTPADYGIREGDLMTVICVGGGGGGGGGSMNSKNTNYYCGSGGSAGSQGGAGSHRLLSGGGGGGFGAGGGGGGVYIFGLTSNDATGMCGGAGGGAGYMTIKSILTTEELINSEIPVTIGSRGTGGNRAVAVGASGSAGGFGGTTSFGAYLSAAGGSGGTGGQFNASYTQGGNGGMAKGGSGHGYSWPFAAIYNAATTSPGTGYCYAAPGGGGAGGFVLGGYVGGNGGSGKGNAGGSGNVRFVFHSLNRPIATSANNTATANFVIQNEPIESISTSTSRGSGLGGNGGMSTYGYTFNGYGVENVAFAGSNIGHNNPGGGCVVVMW